MENQKNNGGLIALVIVLFLLVLGLGGYILYDKVLNNKEVKCKDTENSAVDNNTSSNSEENDVSDNNQNVSNNVNKELYSFEVNDDLHSEFRIQQIGNLFVAFSREKGKQCFPDNVIIYNSNGEILKKFEHAQVTIDTNSIKLHTSDNGQCMGPDWESHVSDYIVNGSQLIEQ